MFYYVYLLKSKKDNFSYVGSTKDLKRRFEEHQKGKVFSTKKHLPLEVVYYEGSKSLKDARIRERYLKTTYGRRYLKNRIKSYSTG